MNYSMYIIRHENSMGYDMRTAWVQHVYTICFYMFLYEVNVLRRHELKFVTSLFSFFLRVISTEHKKNPVCVAVAGPAVGGGPSLRLLFYNIPPGCMQISNTGVGQFQGGDDTTILRAAPLQ